MNRIHATTVMRRRLLVILAVMGSACAAVAGLAAPAFASSTWGSDGFQITCHGSSGGPVGVKETVHVGIIYDGIHAAPNPLTYIGINNPDSDHSKADGVAHQCGVNDTTQAMDTGWSVDKWTNVGNDPQNTYYDVTLSRIISYPGTTESPNNIESPGAGHAFINMGAPIIPDSPSPFGGGGPNPCQFIGDVASDGISLAVTGTFENTCGTDVPIINFNCYQGGNLIGSSSAFPFAKGTPSQVGYAIPAGADNCTVNVWGAHASGNGNQMVPDYGFGIPWSPTTGFGTGSWKHRETGNHAPLGVPANLHVTAGGKVTWNAVSGAVYYAVDRDPGTPSDTMVFVDASQASFQDTISDGKAHSYMVAAQPDLFPAQSAPWAHYTAQAPLNLHYSKGVLSWDAVVRPAAQNMYDLFLNNALTATVPGTSYAPTAFKASASGTKFTATVMAADLIGSPVSDPGIPVTFTYLTQPTGVTAAQGCAFAGRGVPCTPQTAAVVQWSAVSGATTYNVYRNGNLIASGINPATSGNAYADTSVTGGGTSYTYTVTAVAADGSESAASPNAQVTIY